MRSWWPPELRTRTGSPCLWHGFMMFNVEEVEAVQDGWENKARAALIALEEEKKRVLERSETVRQLTLRVHDLEANEGDVHRKKGAAERKAVVLERQIGGYVEDIERLETRYHEGVLELKIVI